MAGQWVRRTGAFGVSWVTVWDSSVPSLVSQPLTCSFAIKKNNAEQSPHISYLQQDHYSLGRLLDIEQFCQGNKDPWTPPQHARLD